MKPTTSAFPTNTLNVPFADADNPKYAGMTLRDYFAASVIQGAMSASRNTDRGQIYTADASTWAELAYAFADAMLKERDK